MSETQTPTATSSSSSPGVGQICWLEVPVTDPSRAKEFYSSVLGWDCDPAGKPSVMTGAENAIHFFHKGESLHGAFIQMPEDGNCLIRAWDAEDPLAMSVLTTYCVDSIEDTLAKVESHGGKVHVPKTAIGGNMGYFSRFIDSEGNLQGLWAMN
ncbi:putative glyoxalase bleomycin resistance protein dioxygenase protein [Phaeoacremonium minimum UCRPA7]|uniref:Putative glyoxalase bleomycin resistance protein dioxygenase protein n=1 Tax=Phaeoacremonium minimum (strain UCR-PA7) TaxID=1286976 RepID=R8BLX4_PHAM7|nr:putative glyoxalase bleomycin resistance protein dioxygenase protein [Phaeoacremonium minimum UCRPA7]EOO00358.1 putative glyoxalase bleomycin resistance protein dioxygenase protein [Phaeoacremonium minimum UCRPA7]